MMKIDRSNYESWFLDYLEGRIGEDMVDEFIEFISRNPDLKEELRLFEPVGLTAEPLVFKGKKKLYKEPLDLPSEFDHMAVARMEGDLDQNETACFDDYLNRHPEKRSGMELFRLTRLEADSAVVFRLKHRLYRRPVVRELAGQLLRVAAVFFFILAVYALAFQPWKNVPDQMTNSGSPVFSGISPQSNADNKGQKASSAASIASLPTKKRPAAHPALKAKEQSPVDQTAENRVYSENKPIEIPSYLPRLDGIVMPGPEPMVLAVIKSSGNTNEIIREKMPEPTYLSDKLVEKLGIRNVNLGKIARSGLDLAMQLTKDKFSYREDDSGKITAYHLETRLLGVSLPVGNVKAVPGE